MPRSRAIVACAHALSAALAGSGIAPPVSAATVVKDCADCPELVPIPGGRFVMGAAPGEEERERLAEEFGHRSVPQREIEVPAFFAGRFEITRSQYRAFAEATGRSAGDGCFVWSQGGFELQPDKSWRAPSYPQTDAHPVVCVSWNDAQAYLSWLSRKSGRSYRLLSEAEWEYAARAGSASARFWGDDAEASCRYANGADLTARRRVPGTIIQDHVRCDDGHAYTAPVGSYAPNAFGLHDMLGNAWEWTQDCWNPDYTDAAPDAAAAASGECAMRVVRGGFWDDSPTALRAAYRVGSPTTVRVYGRGFRVVRDLP
jgi:formylglycine-generating enzyme required for sulfatase activity